MRVGIIGSRDYQSLNLIEKFVKEQLLPEDIVVSGGARGPDSEGVKWARQRGLQVVEYPVKGKFASKGDFAKAAMMRNTSIVKDSDVIIAFWDGRSNGTRDSLKKAIKLNKPTFVVLDDGAAFEIIDMPEDNVFIAVGDLFSYFTKNPHYPTNKSELKSFQRGQSKIPALVNPCNTVGVYGGGLSKSIMTRWPHLVEYYKRACDLETLQVGQLAIAPEHQGPYIIHFPTKAHWKNASELAYIEEGLNDLIDKITHWPPITSIAWPLLGCGLGGLKSKDVLPLMITKLSKLCLTSIIYVPRIREGKKDMTLNGFMEVTLVGVVNDDIKNFEEADGSMTSSFSLNIRDYKSGQHETIDCKAYQKPAGVISRYLEPGNTVLIKGVPNFTQSKIAVQTIIILDNVNADDINTQEPEFVVKEAEVIRMNGNAQTFPVPPLPPPGVQIPKTEEKIEPAFSAMSVKSLPPLPPDRE